MKDFVENIPTSYLPFIATGCIIDSFCHSLKITCTLFCTIFSFLNYKITVPHCKLFNFLLLSNRPDMTDFEQTIEERGRYFRSSPKISNGPDTRYFSIPSILPSHQRNENQARPELFHSASIFVHSRIRIKNFFQ